METMKTQKTSFNLMLPLLFSLLSLKVPISFGADTISGNQTLSGDETLISKEGNFELGFFKPGNSNSSNFYIGIWYKKVSEQTTVWVANRENPVNDKYSSQLRIQGRKLVLLNESHIVIWFTDVSSTSSGPLVAVLRDDGNFILKEVSSSNLSNSSSVSPVWQSFDYPTNTWLPGGKLSYNKITRKQQILTSWNNSEDPRPGLFSLAFDPPSKQYVISRNRTEQYWTSGLWNGQIFSKVPELMDKHYYKFAYIDNENETYFTYTVYNYNLAVTSRVVMDASGQLKSLAWLESTKVWITFWAQPRQQCDVYSYCGAFGICIEKSSSSCSCLDGYKPKSDQDWNLNDFSGGCERKKSFQCESNSSAKGEKDKFWMHPQMRLNMNPQPVAVGSAAECESTCLSNCSCTAYAYDSNQCSVWNGELLNLQQLSEDDGSGRKINIRLAASEFSSGKNSKGIEIGSAVGSVVVALVVLGLVLFVMQRLRSRMVVSGKTAGGSLLAFAYKDLQKATKNFSEKLGGGGFGAVFKGTLPDSSVIAVKKLESISQGEKQFRTEVSTIGRIQHVNLVRLRGFCSEGEKKLLVYEYLENSSLDFHLFHDNESNVLDWKTRYQIALGTARGLTYLHDKCREVVIHCDIKPENILLDAELCPKVADFGLAKLMGRDFSRVLTTIRGTRGYLAPEWISGVAISAKADVYSYGMMLFEFISGRRNTENHMDGAVKFFPTWAARVIIDEGDILSLLDPKLDGIADAEEMSRLCKVACWCVQEDENHRPSIGQVVQILEGVLDVNLPPVPRSLLWFVDNQEHIVFFTESSSNLSSETQTKTPSSSSNSKRSSSSKD